MPEQPLHVTVAAQTVRRLRRLILRTFYSQSEAGTRSGDGFKSLLGKRRRLPRGAANTYPALVQFQGSSVVRQLNHLSEQSISISTTRPCSDHG